MNLVSFLLGIRFSVIWQWTFRGVCQLEKKPKSDFVVFLNLKKINVLESEYFKFKEKDREKEKNSGVQ